MKVSALVAMCWFTALQGGPGGKVVSLELLNANLLVQSFYHQLNCNSEIIFFAHKN
jgi:hypothetical protein